MFEQSKNRHYVNPQTIREDLSAGLVLGIESIPDGMASGLLAAVNPVYGIYGYMMGLFGGALFTSSVFMSVQATGAMSLVVASVPQVTQSHDPNTMLFALAILTGLFMLLAGLFKLGSLVRFVPNSVMVGFINAVAVLIILGQLDNFTGYNSVGANKVAKTIDLALNLQAAHLETVMVGLLTIFLIITLEKTALKSLGLVAALIAASLVVPLFHWDAVAQVRDIADIPASLPRPLLPPLADFFSLMIPAFSLAFVGLMQGVSITMSVPNPDGRYPDASGDFVGQGAANILSGLFQGTPVGGSMSATAIVTNAGARSRLGNLSASLVMAVCILLFGRAIGSIAMPALAGLLIVVGFRTLKPAQVEMVWKTGWVQRTIMLITFISALLIPLQYAVLVGIALAVLLFVFQQSNKVMVKEWTFKEGSLPRESDPPPAVPPATAIALMPYGSLFYAAAPMFAAQLPDVTAESQHAVVIIGLRGEKEVGSTFLQVIERYARELQGQDSKLMLTGVEQSVRLQLERTGVARTIGRENIYMATDEPGRALLDALTAAELWIAAQEETGRNNQQPTIND
ncbi:MAG: SulP family inorganic anion transporter [Candidatus Promineifilaceae bacterium]|jgi:sulfate permease, SulP family